MHTLVGYEPTSVPAKAASTILQWLYLL